MLVNYRAALFKGFFGFLDAIGIICAIGIVAVMLAASVQAPTELSIGIGNIFAFLEGDLNHFCAKFCQSDRVAREDVLVCGPSPKKESLLPASLLDEVVAGVVPLLVQYRIACC